MTDDDRRDGPNANEDSAPDAPYSADPWMKDPWIERGLSPEEREARADDVVDEEWAQTPEMPKEERDQQMRTEINRLVWVSIVVAIALSLAVALGAVLGIGWLRQVLPGFAIGSAVAVVNLRLMASAAKHLFESEPMGAVLGFGASFALLIGGAVFILKTDAAWMLGYGLGIALPAVSGLAYAIWSAKLAEAALADD